MQDFLQFIFAGLTGGAIYALVALGFGVVHNTMGIVNFTQVDFVSLGGMLLYSALFAMGLPMPLALALAVAGVTATALAVQVLGIRPARTDNHLVLIFLTIGLSIFLRGVMKLVWGKNRLAVPPLAGEAPVQVLGATILPQTLWILALTGVAIVLLVLFFRKTSLGLAMRAVAANEQAARVVGLECRPGKGPELCPGWRFGGPGRGSRNPHHHPGLRRGGTPGPQGLRRRHPRWLWLISGRHCRGDYPGPPGEPHRRVSEQRL